MNKKGQVYILAALLLGVIIYSLTTVPNRVMQEEFKGDFEKLSNNYQIESAKLINSILLSKKDVLNSFTNFTTIFMSYSKTQNPNFGVIASLNYKNTLRIGNYLKQPLVIDSDEGLNYAEGCFSQISSRLKFQGLVINFDAAQIEDVEECFIEIPFQDKIWIGLILEDEIAWYPFNIKADTPQLIVLNMQEEARQRRMYVSEDGYVRTETRQVSETEEELIKKRLEED